jgi:hypothetical protein
VALVRITNSLKNVNEKSNPRNKKGKNISNSNTLKGRLAQMALYLGCPSLN